MTDRKHLRLAKAGLPVALVALSVLAQAEIQYRVSAAPGQPRMSVEIKVPKPGSKVSFQMPNWSPGAYVLSKPAQRVEGFSAMDGANRAVAFEKENDYTWTLTGKPDGAVTVRYTVPINFNAGAANYSGPSTYMYLVGRKNEECRVTFDVPSDWRIATGLAVARDGKTYSAPTYDVLADCPVTLGDFRDATYLSAGKPHRIVLYGPTKSDVDLAYLTKACKAVSDMQTNYFGGAPYDFYVWHFSVSDRLDGAGGLEHLNSTQIGLASGVGPRAVGVLAHEFFHLWNVKRIRSKPLGPFDYTQLPKTGALWWLEGVTDYFAHTLLHRYGWYDRTRLYSDVSQNYHTVFANPARLEVSPYDASYRVGEANNGIGNSNGYKVSYYDTGWLVGLCLDIELLSRTDGKHSLDDVERGLWALCKNGKPGFEEDEIRKQCVKFGGPELGTYYDQIVMKPGDLPVAQQLAKVGLQVADVKRQDPDFGYSWEAGAGIIKASSPHGAAANLINAGDAIVAINGKAISGATGRALSQSYNDAVAGIKPGDKIVVTVKRGEATQEVSYTVGSTERTVTEVTEMPNASPQALRLRALWTSAKRR